MEGGIYLLQDGGLVGLDEQAYEAERVLQGLLTKHPNLLAGDQVDATAPRRWLLVTREAPVSGEDGGARGCGRSISERSARKGYELDAHGAI